MFDIGSGEMLVILVLALLLFGGSLPDVARNLGRSVGELKRSFADNTRPLLDAKNDIEREVAEVGRLDGAGRIDGPGGKDAEKPGDRPDPGLPSGDGPKP